MGGGRGEGWRGTEGRGEGWRGTEGRGEGVGRGKEGRGGCGQRKKEVGGEGVGREKRYTHRSPNRDCIDSIAVDSITATTHMGDVTIDNTIALTRLPILVRLPIPPSCLLFRLPVTLRSLQRPILPLSEPPPTHTCVSFRFPPSPQGKRREGCPRVQQPSQEDSDPGRTHGTLSRQVRGGGGGERTWQRCVCGCVCKVC